MATGKTITRAVQLDMTARAKILMKILLPPEEHDEDELCEELWDLITELGNVKQVRPKKLKNLRRAN